jgi:tetratricopeptide (TPR) repeat protein
MTQSEPNFPSSDAAKELEFLDDEEILALAEALKIGAVGESANRDDPVARGLELIRLAMEHPSGSETNIESGRRHSETPSDRRQWTEELPQTIGRFSIRAEIGRGGFGIVVLASDPVLNRLVALKVPRLQGLFSRESRIRFEREAKAVAMLSHPGIVPLFETDLDGPIQYIAFGHVPGESLSAFLERRGRVSSSLAARIVARLAEAVAHAHQRGVVHRDLKPANILIESGSEDARVSDERLVESLKIADFGLAKFVDPNSAGITREGAMLGTPSYMAPEQAAGREDLIGPVSDVYGLGAILYELLTGRPPFREATAAATMRAVEQQPPASIRRLASKVPRDLEAICLKCLEKSPRNRYGGAMDLAADLHRWLAGEAVKARPVGASGRLLRWCCRNPTLAAALGVTFASLGSGLAITLYQQQQLRNQIAAIGAEKSRADAQTERAFQSERATLEAMNEIRRQKAIADDHYAISHAVRGFLYADLLGQGDPVQQLSSLQRLRNMGIEDFQFSPNPTLNELLTRVLPQLEPERLEERFPGQEVVHAELLATVGEVLLRQNLHQEAVGLLERARTLRRQLLEQDDLVLLRTESLLAEAWKHLGQWDNATELYQLVRERYSNLNPVSAETLRSRRALAELLILRGQSDEAIVEYQAILQTARESHALDSTIRHEAVMDLAVTLINSNQITDAIGVLRAELPAIETDKPIENRNDLEARRLLALALVRSNEVKRALPLLTRVVAADQEFIGSQHPDALRSRLTLAEALYRSGDSAQAIVVFSQVRDEAATSYGDRSTIFLNATNNLATIHWKQGRLEQSIPLFEQVCELAVDRFGANHRSTLYYQANLAVNYRDAERFDDAIPLLRVAAEASTKFPNLEWTNKELFMACFRSGRLADAEDFSREWIQRVESKQDRPTGTSALAAHTSLGRVLLALNRPTEAEAALRLAIDAANNNAQPLSRRYWPLEEARALLGLSVAQQGRSGEALELLTPACESLVARKDDIPQASQKSLGALFEDYSRVLESAGESELAARWNETASLWKK